MMNSDNNTLGLPTYHSVAPLASAEQRIAAVQKKVALSVADARKNSPIKLATIDDVWQTWLLK